MAKTSKTIKKNGAGRTTPIKAIALNKMHAFTIARSGIGTSRDLSNFHEAILADIYSGADLQVVDRALKVTGQMIAHENMKLRAGIKRGFLSLDK